MSTGASGSDEKISGAKIDPLASDQKEGIPHDQGSRGVAGTDRSIDQTRVEPLGGHGESWASAYTAVIAWQSSTTHLSQGGRG